MSLLEHIGMMIMEVIQEVVIYLKEITLMDHGMK